MKDDTLVDRDWPIALIEEIYTGDDGIVRVADIRCHGKTYRRAVNHFVLLVENEMESPSLSPPEDVRAQALKEKTEEEAPETSASPKEEEVIVGQVKIVTQETQNSAHIKPLQFCVIDLIIFHVQIYVQNIALFDLTIVYWVIECTLLGAPDKTAIAQVTAVASEAIPCASGCRAQSWSFELKLRPDSCPPVSGVTPAST